MFDPASAIALIGLARSVINVVVEQVTIARAKGEITPEQEARIRERAGLADAEWDEVVAQAKEREALKKQS